MTGPIAILGGGQLGRMLGLAGAPLGQSFRFMDQKARTSAAQVGELIVGEWDDEDALRRLRDGASVVTYEFENVPVQTARALNDSVPVYPPPKALAVAQDRFMERSLFADVGIPTPPWTAIDSLDELKQALKTAELPALLKARRLGYDGKGQFLVCAEAEAERAWDALGKVPALLDAFIDFEQEVSVLAVRGQVGSDEERTAFYPLTHNVHRGGILRVSRAPAFAEDDPLTKMAFDYARRVLDALDYIGVLAMEFFVVRDASGERQLIANEIAPRVHNSGHWTIEGAETSQFENHLRAVAGLPLGPTHALGASAMVNIIGDLPRVEAVLAVPGAHLHLYGKEPRPGRKIGHVTLRADSGAEVERLLERFTRIIG